MDLQEIIKQINMKSLNVKCNNYIYSNLTKEEIENIIHNIKENMLINNFNDIATEYDAPKHDYLTNIIIDLQNISVNDILDYTFKELLISEELSYCNLKSLITFKSILSRYKKGIQFIFYNNHTLSEEEQALINDIFTLNTYSLITTFLVTKRDDIKTFMTTKKRMLDNREDYNLF